MDLLPTRSPPELVLNHTSYAALNRLLFASLVSPLSAQFYDVKTELI